MLFVVLCVCFGLSLVEGQNLGGYCQTPLGESAKCINVYECAPVIALVRSPSRTVEQTKLLADLKCGYDSRGTPYVCCGSSFTKVVTSAADSSFDSNYTQNSLIPDRTKCGWQAADRIINGENTAFDEFPWMVIIQYLKSNGNRRIGCAGSLINSRYVLTAAHCVTGEVLTKVGTPINVRLGEYDTSSPGRDCLRKKGVQYCNQQEINAGIDELIPHPGYTGDTNRLHDIALIRLDREVQFSDFIQAICLPLPTEASRTGEKLVVAGWGKTEQGRDSNVKLKLEVPVVDHTSCVNTFSPLSVRLSTNQVCAGGEDGKDSCTGDSGGPLMRTIQDDDKRWMIEGVVSFGYNFCGTRGYPGVYTKVARYVPWIHKTVR